MGEHAALRTNYDDIADTLYLTIGDEKPVEYIEDVEHEGIVWRVSRSGREYGVTVLDYVEFWAEQQSSLAALIAQHLSVSRDDAAAALKL